MPNGATNIVKHSDGRWQYTYFASKSCTNYKTFLNAPDFNLMSNFKTDRNWKERAANWFMIKSSTNFILFSKLFLLKCLSNALFSDYNNVLQKGFLWVF